MHEDLQHMLERMFRSGRFELVEILTDEQLGGFDRGQGECHQNAKRWMMMPGHEGCTIAEGWVHYHNGRFAKHSVVRQNDGRLIDVTWLQSTTSEGTKFVGHPSDYDVPFDQMPVSIPY